jgi:hypothetical protein
MLPRPHSCTTSCKANGEGGKLTVGVCLRKITAVHAHARLCTHVRRPHHLSDAQKRARGSWTHFSSHMLLLDPSPWHNARPTLARQCAARRTEQLRMGGSVFNKVSSNWLLQISFLCWKALAVAKVIENVANEELAAAEASSHRLANMISSSSAILISFETADTCRSFQSQK